VGWRGSFLIAGFPGIILALLIFTLPDPKRKGPVLEFDYRKIVRELAGISSYVWATLGYCAYSFVVGGVAHWVPTFLQRNHHLDQMKANLLFGGIAVASGLIGTLLGGHLGDRWTAQKGSGGHLRISSLSMLLALPFFIGTLYAPSIEWLVFFLVFTQLFFFISTSPINVALIEAVPSQAQTTAMAIAIFLCHILGDAISSPLIGLISDASGSLQKGMAICIPMILISSLCWRKGMLNREKIVSE
jgi:sugar phosphate permease